VEIPEIHTLSTVDWQFFGSLTFRSERHSERVRLAMWFALARRLAKWNRVHFLNLLWCLRMEKGEIGGRKHFHCLISGLPEGSVNVATCFSIMRQWERFGGGMARVRIYNPALHGGEYILKCLGSGADVYESAKFGEVGRDLMLSKSVRRVALSSKRRARKSLCDQILEGAKLSLAGRAIHGVEISAV